MMGGVEAAVVGLRKQKLMRRMGEYTITISALGRKSSWSAALDLLREMRRSWQRPNVISYSAAISACEKGHQ